MTIEFETTIWNVTAQLTYCTVVDREVKKNGESCFSFLNMAATPMTLFIWAKTNIFHATLVFLFTPEVVGCRQAVWSNCLGQYRVSHKHSP